LTRTNLHSLKYGVFGTAKQEKEKKKRAETLTRVFF